LNENSVHDGYGEELQIPNFEKFLPHHTNDEATPVQSTVSATVISQIVK